MKLSLTYPTPIWIDNFSNANIDNEKLSDAILDEMDSGKGMVLHELDGWRNGNNKELFEKEEFKILLLKIEENLDEILKQYDINPKYELKECDGWSYVTEKGGWHPPHCHPGGFLSCVYYVKVPEDSDSNIVFDDPRQNLSMLNKPDTFLKENVFNHARIRLNPKTGDFYVFPSWLNHFVSPSMSDEKRIIMTLNFPLGEK